MTIKKYLEGSIRYDEEYGHVVAGAKNICMIRGWSEIMEKMGGDVAKTYDFQLELGRFVAEAIKEKLEKL